MESGQRKSVNNKFRIPANSVNIEYKDQVYTPATSDCIHNW